MRQLTRISQSIPTFYKSLSEPSNARFIRRQDKIWTAAGRVANSERLFDKHTTPSRPCVAVLVRGELGRLWSSGLVWTVGNYAAVIYSLVRPGAVMPPAWPSLAWPLHRRMGRKTKDLIACKFCFPPSPGAAVYVSQEHISFKVEYFSYRTIVMREWVILRYWASSVLWVSGLSKV